MFFRANFHNLMIFFQKMKKNINKLSFLELFSPIFELKIIQLVRFRPKHLLGHRLYQHFCKNVITHLRQSLFNIN
jgi:hypothetical protein